MFIDRARIRVVAGKGGDGCVSFRREKYVPRGGPDGGDGGRGADVFIQADPRENSLIDLRYHSTWIAPRGEHGRGKGQHGKSAEDLFIKVPPGTVIKERNSGRLLCDLAVPEQTYLAAHGGKGGRGNARFVTSTHRAPKFAEKGEPGEEIELELELKLIADVGIVGLPNAGKSTLLSAISAARPKIADYPFTTLAPNLGVVELSGFRTFTVADIPGIIEGAAAGKGLGHEFLRHIERTKILLFLIDPSDQDPDETLAVLEKELAEFSPAFGDKPRLIVFSKADIPASAERFEALRREYPDAFLISSVTGEGIKPLLEKLAATKDRVDQEQIAATPEPPREAEYAYEAPFTVERTREGFHVEGKKVEQAVRMTDFENEEAVHHLQRRLTKMGLYKALKKLGAREGVPVEIAGVELEYRPD